MKQIGFYLEKISCKAICIMTAAILAAFSYWAGKYTHLVNVDLVNLKVRLYEDSIVKNMLVFLFIIFLLFFVSKRIFTKKEEENKKKVHRIAVIIAIAVGILSAIWAVLIPYRPDHDQLQIVQDALDFANGDYSDLKGYLEIFPYQLGLVHLYKILFAICPNTEIIYFFHAIWIAAIIYGTYAISEELFQNSKVSLYSMIAAVSFIPMYFYVNYAYGDLSVAACGIIGIWCLIKYCKTNKIRYAVGMVCIMIFSYLARTNALIVMIALGITLLIHSIRQKDWKSLLTAVLVICLPLFCSSMLLTMYQKKANVEMLDGAPAILTIAMGMQDTYEGPGYYNAYNLTVYVNSEKDASAAADIAKQYIEARVIEMRQNLADTKNFYQVKIWQQWNEPSFGGEVSTHTFQGDVSSLVISTYYGHIQQFLRIFRNYYLFILYAGVLAATVYKIVFEKEDAIWKNVILIIFIGGFLFSLLWESKSRYVMPYVAMLFPYGAYGWYRVQTLLGKQVKKISLLFG